MYLNFYNLKKEAFHITPDPEFLYLSPSHKEALAAIIYGINQRKGFVAIIGGVGVGKTTILRSYLDSSDKDRLKIVYIFNARLAFEGLLKTIFQELDIPLTTTDTIEMVNDLYHVLIEEYRQGKSVVLVIDEAQNMPLDTLENLRMLSNLETSKDKLIQIVLIGQPEFEGSLNLHNLRQLKQRIAIRSTILPLTRDESLEYIQHRIRRAGGNNYAIFTKSALSAIVGKANGIPRVINILCDNALVTGFGYQQKPVSAKIVKEVISDLEGEKRRFFVKWRLPLGFSAIILVIIVLLFFHYDKFIALKFPAMELLKMNITKPIGVSIPITPHTSKAPEEISGQSSGAFAKPAATSVSAVPENLGQLKVKEEQPTSRKRTLSRSKAATKPAPYPEPTQEAFHGTGPATGITVDVSGDTDDKLTTLIREKKSEAINSEVIATGSAINLPPKPAGE